MIDVGLHSVEDMSKFVVNFSHPLLHEGSDSLRTIFFRILRCESSHLNRAAIETKLPHYSSREDDQAVRKESRLKSEQVFQRIFKTRKFYHQFRRFCWKRKSFQEFKQLKAHSPKILLSYRNQDLYSTLGSIRLTYLIARFRRLFKAKYEEREFSRRIRRVRIEKFKRKTVQKYQEHLRYLPTTKKRVKTLFRLKEMGEEGSRLIERILVKPKRRLLLSKVGKMVEKVERTLTDDQKVSCYWGIRTACLMLVVKYENDDSVYLSDFLPFFQAKKRSINQRLLTLFRRQEALLLHILDWRLS